jgi:hypothetical protein
MKRSSKLREWGVKITTKQLEELFNNHNGLCDICGQPENYKGRKRLSVDHCHKTLKIRGLVCNRCNVLLGMSLDNPETLLKAVAYLGKSD